MAQTAASSATIRTTLQQCIHGYAQLLPQITDQQRLAAVKLQLDRLKLWAGNVGAFADDKASADYRLRDDEDTKNVILGLLRRLTQKASTYDGNSKQFAPKVSSSTSDSESRETASSDRGSQDEEDFQSGSDSLDESERSVSSGRQASSNTWAEGIAQSINSLFLLASTIRKPIRYQNNTRILKSAETSGPMAEQLTDLASHVRFQLKGKHDLRTEADAILISDTIVDRLVDAAVFRLQRFNYNKKHGRKLRHGIDDAFKPLILPTTNLQQSVIGSVPRAVQDANIAEPSQPLPPQSVPATMLSATAASSLQPRKVETLQKPAASLISHSAVLRHGRLDFPPIPKVSLGQDLICPYCLQPLDSASTTTKTWRSHILSDLEPYVCVFEQCKDGAKLYNKIDDAMQHMRWSHGMVWSCNAPGHEQAVFESSVDLLTHMRTSHSASFSEAQAAFIVEKSMRPSQEAFQSCPFCPEGVDNSLLHNKSTVHRDAMKWFRNHVAQHLEFLALFSLPPRSDTGEAEAEESQIKQHDDLTLSSITEESTFVTKVGVDTGMDQDEILDYNHKVPDVANDIEYFTQYHYKNDIQLRQDEDPTLTTFVERAQAEDYVLSSSLSPTTDMSFDMLETSSKPLVFSEHLRNLEPRKAAADRYRGAFLTCNYDTLKDIHPSQEPQTGRWIMDHDLYRDWLDSRAGEVLGITADTGSGKSVFCKFLVDSSLNSPPEGYSVDCQRIFYFFFKRVSPHDGVSTALCAMIHQLLGQCSNFDYDQLPPGFDDVGYVLESRDRLWQLLLRISDLLLPTLRDLRTRSPNTCIFDALDEVNVSDRDWLMGQLQVFHKTAVARPNRRRSIRFLVTYRSGTFTETFTNLQVDDLQIPTINLTSRSVNVQYQKEIELLISRHMDEHDRSMQMSTLARTNLELALRGTKNRSQLWLRLTLDNVKRALSSGVISSKAITARVSPNLSDAYEVLLSNTVPSTETSLLRNILAIMTNFRVFMAPFEIGQALAVYITMDDTAPDETLDLSVKQLSTSVRRLIRGTEKGRYDEFFYVVGDRACFCNDNLRDFLFIERSSPGDQQGGTDRPWKGCLSHTETPSFVARLCIRYLWVYEPEKDAGRGREELVHCCASSWPDLLRVVEAEVDRDDTKRFIDMLYDSSSALFDKWINLAAPREHLEMLGTSRLELASIHGHIRRLQMYLAESPEKVNAVGKTSRTPLIWATLLNRVEAVKLLLLSGADPDIVSKFSESALVVACAHGHDEIVQQLIRFGADLELMVEKSKSPLVMASVKGHVSTVEILLQAGAYVDALGAGGNEAALQAASFHGWLKIVQLLLSHGANVNLRGGFCGSALHMAAKYGHDNVVNLLLNYGADINAFATNFEGTDFGTALQLACANDRLSTVRILIRRGADINAIGGPCGSSLRAACLNGHGKIVDLLIDHNVDVTADTYDTIGDMLGSALDAAISSGHRSIVSRLLAVGNIAEDSFVSFEFVRRALGLAVKRFDCAIITQLLEHSAKVRLNEMCDIALYCASVEYFGPITVNHILTSHSPTTEGVRDALVAACTMGHEKVVEVLLEHGASIDATVLSSTLLLAVDHEQSTIVSMLLRAGADANFLDIDKGRPLHVAVHRGLSDSVELLITAGADVNISRCDGQTPLYQAVVGGHVKVAQILLAAGANVNWNGSMTGTALIEAIRSSNLQMVKCLIESGADPNDNGNTYHGPLHLAAALGDIEILEVLHDAGCDLFSRALTSDTALHMAVFAGKYEAVEFLLRAGVDVNIQTAYGTTALHIAAGRAMPRMLRLLLEDGAKVDIKDEKGDTALHVARRNHRPEQVQLLLRFGARTDILNSLGEKALVST